MSDACSSCGAALAPNRRRKGTRCKPCVARSHSSDPVILAKRSATIQALRRDPERRERWRLAVQAAWRRRLQDPGAREQARLAGMQLQRPDNRAKGDAARRGARLPWCPAGYQDEYRRLQRKGFRAGEAKRILLAQIARDEVRAKPLPWHHPEAAIEGSRRLVRAIDRLRGAA
jgi:hypothetical protein